MRIKELEDFDWFPAILRKYQMEFIGMMVSKFGLYHQVAKVIHNDLSKYNIFNIIDLCSGSGLPAIYIHEALALKGLKTTLTDKFPQPIGAIDGVEYMTSPFDVNDITPCKQNYYTIFNAFHHLEQDERKGLIQKILNNECHMMIVEIVQPTLTNFLLVTLASTLGVWLLCPFIRPFEWKRLFFTYILPINVLTVLIDGYISILKSKTVHQYRSELKSISDHHTRVEVASHFSFPAYLVTIKVSPSHV